ncbi:uncharacterized protein LOC105188492 [Harpegnathos saltator]|uniref:uncharacterized protein LOC105188492 n=1 Tax=Harpegnathos saltator TaxID=610380 RepID=UPI00058D6EE5|nr:uncharacterized protein LOC105188492 [Harpegnathos saltator]XP_025163233.1 uncharacterized protein LOC105188492 [Harpegnathos saltator]
MNPSPTANRSFLHSHKAALISDKVVYATLDSLALKRTRLPLQLLPVDDDNVEKTGKADKEKRPIGGKISSKHSTCKVKSGASHQWKSYSKYLIFSSAKSENQSTCSAAIPNSGTERDIENTGREEISVLANATKYIENSVEIAPSPSIKEESCMKDFPNGDSRNLTHPQTEKSSRDDADTVEDQGEKKKYPIERQDSSSSGDYEKMDIVNCKVSMLERSPSNFEPEVPKRKTLERVSRIDKVEESTPTTLNAAAKSKSLIDLATEEHLYESTHVKYSKEDTESTTSGENDASSRQKKKKHKRFAKNVLHYVPRHLVKQPKKKKKLKKKYALSSSLSSLRSLYPAPSKTVQNSCSTRSLPRELTISPPSNFVHVASATNPSLVSNENTVKSTVVITHQQICATLPLLVGKDERRATVGNENVERSKVVSGMSSMDDVSSSQPMGESTDESVADRNGRTHYAEIKSESSSDQQSQAAKVLETGQMVKIAIENQADPPEGETYEQVCQSCPRALPQVNSSFLWSNHRAKTFPSDKHDTRASTTNENEEDVDSEEYDDVGPSNFVAQAESDYDDVGPPKIREDEKLAVISNDCEEIYDDVMPAAFKRDNSAVEKNNQSVSKAVDEESNKEQQPLVELRATSRGRAEASLFASSDDRYFTMNNEYSKVDEADLGEEERDELDVYDDVGLPEPAEERVNSLYAGSTPGCVFGLPSTNGKESEWEDVEDVSSVSRCQENDLREKESEGQAASGKKLIQRWSRKTRKQRSRRSRRNMKATTRATLDVANADSASDDSTYESLYSCQQDDFSSDSEGTSEAADKRQHPRRHASDGDCVINTYMECPTRPTPPPPREASLTQSLGRRVKMLRRTWSITKGSLGRIRRRTSVEECFDEKEQSEHHHHHHVDIGKYFNFRRRFRKSFASPSTFYVDENGRSDVCGTADNNNGIAKEAIYTNSQYMGSSSDDSSRSLVTGIDHYSVLADQEPLYQFYAAAVARVAFESDSEGYEEVENTMWKKSPAPADLARLGQRMLWCHTPQVIHSGLLERLTPEEKKIQEAKFEILTSEASYLNSLRVLENEFLNNHALIHEILTPIEMKKLFGGVTSVLSASQTFLAELEAVWREDPMLPGLSDVLIKHAEKYQATYVAYCSNQVSIDITLKDLKARKGAKFLEAVKRIEMRPACQNLSLHSFLMLPMQRVTRLPLLADAIVSKLSMGSLDRASWEQVLSSLSNVVAECNEGARTAAQETEMEALARKLEYSAKIKPIILRGKQLVRKGPVVQLSTKTDTEYKLTFGKKFNKTPLYLLLFTDYLLVTRLKSNTQDESYTVIDACKRNLLALEPASEESPFAGRNAMILTLLENHSGRHVEYIFTCENNTERERWLEAVSPPKRGLVGETLYESWDCPQMMAKYLYTPNQPDELSLQPGDVINVLRKMADGWYHGEKLVGGVQGWFPANYTKEIASEHIRARNLKQRHRLLTLSSSVIQQRMAKQNQVIH